MEIIARKSKRAALLLALLCAGAGSVALLSVLLRPQGVDSSFRRPAVYLLRHCPVPHHPPATGTHRDRRYPPAAVHPRHIPHSAAFLCPERGLRGPCQWVSLPLLRHAGTDPAGGNRNRRSRGRHPQNIRPPAAPVGAGALPPRQSARGRPDIIF